MANVFHINRSTGAITLDQEDATTLLSLDGSNVLQSSNSLSGISPTFGNVYVPAAGTLGVSGGQTIQFNTTFDEIRLDSKYVTIHKESDWNTFELFNYSTETAVNLYLVNRSRGTEASPVIVQDGDVLGSFGGRAYDGSTFQDSARIVFGVDGTPGAGDVPGQIIFRTTPDGSATPSTRMTVKADGSVNIGDGGTTDYSKFESDGNLSFNGAAGFYPRRISQSAEPVNGTGATQIDVDELLVWRDPDDNKTYLVYNDTDEGVRKAEMT